MRQLERVAGVSNCMISQLEGGTRIVRVDSAERIARALQCDIHELFAPPDERTAKRSRPATPPGERWLGGSDGAAHRSQREAEEWRRYLERVARQPDLVEWGRPLSLTRAAARFGVNAPRLNEAADAGRVRSRRVDRPGLVRGYVLEFAEAELAEDITALPRCPFDGCEQPDLGRGACGEHGQKVWAGKARGKKRPREVGEKVSAALRGKPRPDAAERMRRRHEQVREAVNRLKMDEDLMAVTDVAHLWGVAEHSVISYHVFGGILAPAYTRVEGQPRLLFRRADVLAIERPKGQSEFKCKVCGRSITRWPSQEPRLCSLCAPTYRGWFLQAREAAEFALGDIDRDGVPWAGSPVAVALEHAFLAAYAAGLRLQQRLFKQWPRTRGRRPPVASDLAIDVLHRFGFSDATLEVTIAGLLSRELLKIPGVKGRTVSSGYVKQRRDHAGIRRRAA